MATTEIEVRDLSRSRANAGRWGQVVARLRLAAGLRHPAVIRVIDAGLDDGPRTITLEWVGTTTMAAMAGTDRPRPREEAIELVRTVAGVLEESHRLGLAHGRLGPGQVFLVDGRPRLDFTGIDAGFPAGSASSRMLDASLPRSASGAGGGPAADRAADLYGLGVLLVWLLTGGTGPADRETVHRRAGSRRPIWGA